jgi:hypothetical protein
MAQFLRPASDVTSGDWTPSTGTALYAVLDEASPNDGDFITSGSSLDTCEVALTPGSAPGVGDVVLRVRARLTGAPVGLELVAVWASDPAADDYVLQVGTTSGVYNVFNASVGYVLTYTVTGLAAGTYYVRVVPYDGATPLTPTAEQEVVLS